MKYRTVLAEVDDNRHLVPENILSFYSFIYARHRVWYNRFVLKFPRKNWTNDEVLKKSRYTNVYRELDRGTLWWFSHINKRYKSIEDTIWRTCVYRLLNKVETFDIIGVPYLEQFKKAKFRIGWFGDIQKLLNGGVKVWTSAHITLQSNLKANRLENYQTILEKLVLNINALYKNIVNNNSIESAFQEIRKEYGFGPFTSYEVATDLAYCDWSIFNNDTWANAGPGCIPGIKLIFPWAKNQEDYLWCMKLLRSIQKDAFDKYDLNFKKIIYNREFLSLRNIEHSLCEWRKYYSQVRNIGRARPGFDIVSPNTLYD